jgi:hypothetical protein
LVLHWSETHNAFSKNPVGAIAKLRPGEFERRGYGRHGRPRAIVAETWRPNAPEPDTRFSVIRDLNVETRQTLEASGLLAEQPLEIYRWIAGEWQFPM